LKQTQLLKVFGWKVQGGGLMLKKFITEFTQVWSTERPPQLAAALAYFSMFSFAPVIFFAFSIVGLFMDQSALATQFYQRLSSILGEEVARLVQDTIAGLAIPSREGSILFSIISLIALLLVASNIFVQVQFALNSVWHVPLPQKG
jgi:membrane protein